MRIGKSLIKEFNIIREFKDANMGFTVSYKNK